jgi:GT2 family glycosyltransferase
MASPSSPDTLAASYHQSVRTEDHAEAQRLLRLAVQMPAYHDEACLWRGLAELEAQDFELAFLHLARAVERRPAQAELHALLVRCLQQGGLARLALAVLDAALRRHPTSPLLRRCQTPLLAELEASGVLEPHATRKRLRSSLPDLTDPIELRQVLDHLGDAAAGAATDHADGEHRRIVGVVEHDPIRQQISGWAIDLSAPARPLELELEFLHEGRPYRTHIQAAQPSPLLAEAGYPGTQGGFRLQLPQAIDALHVRATDGSALIGSPIAALPVFVPPAPQTAATQRGKKASDKPPVDVLVPVFLGRQATLDCIDSVIEHAARNRSPHRLIVLDDASPDAELVVALKKRARQGKLQYLRRPANLGFIRNMNRGMALHPGRDVVWLNADTRVHGDWLDRLRSAAYSADDVASVTPISNNGELMSFPRMRHAAPMPGAAAHAALDDSARRLALAPIPLETGCGFCLYIKRSALDDVGYLDELELKRGYGEETDWCLRAHARGWRHLGALNVFVAHAGGESFGAEKALRVVHNNAVLRRRYPDAEHNFSRYVAADPLAPARQQLAATIEGGENHKARAWLHTALAELAPTPPRHACTVVTQTPPPARLWLIADRLDRHAAPALAQRWLELARRLARLTRQGCPPAAAPMLLLDHDTPWQVELMATGQVLSLPRLPGLRREDVLAACGHPAALSLAGAHAPDWLATLGSPTAGPATQAHSTARPQPTGQRVTSA